jgi:hypothetical protein
MDLFIYLVFRGLREHKRLIQYETDRIPPGNEHVKETLAWLDKYLEPNCFLLIARSDRDLDLGRVGVQ